MEHRDQEPAAEDFGSEEELSEGQGSEEEEEVLDEEADEEKEESSDEDLVEDEESCGFCLQKLTYMIEPRQRHALIYSVYLVCKRTRRKIVQYVGEYLIMFMCEKGVAQPVSP